MQELTLIVSRTEKLHAADIIKALARITSVLAMAKYVSQRVASKLELAGTTRDRTAEQHGSVCNVTCTEHRTLCADAVVSMINAMKKPCTVETNQKDNN